MVCGRERGGVCSVWEGERSDMWCVGGREEGCVVCGRERGVICGVWEGERRGV